ncbi:MAG: hypothetical protein GXZ18_03325 [Synergistaceae bacterium]|nr:hypothetical protein [Synergistaceae bacterium]
MVRRYDSREEDHRGFRLEYWLAIFLIIIVWIWAFKLYFDRYEDMRPEVTWAIQGINTEIVKAQGVLLWKESVLTASKSGTVSYPQGTGPTKVVRGSIIATIISDSTPIDIKAPDVGYFIAGTDGLESKWMYSQLWNEDEIPSDIQPVTMKKNGDAVAAGESIGKLIMLPQELKFLGKIDITGDLSDQLKNKSLRVMMDEMDMVSRADVRVSKSIGNTMKVYLTLPWFQPEVLSSRKCILTIEAGITKGALIPETSVVFKNGTYKVYLVRGTRVVLRSVEGKDVGDSKFLVTNGISIGDAVIKDASGAREGRIQLW